MFSTSSPRGQTGRGTERDDCKEIDYRAEDKKPTERVIRDRGVVAAENISLAFSSLCLTSVLLSRDRTRHMFFFLAASSDSRSN